jgi:hypothetical protein
MAAAAAGTLLVGSGLAVTAATAPSAAHAPSARYLSQARSALVRYLADGHSPAEFARPVPRHTVNSSALSSYNWSGYADSSSTDGTFTSVSGSWTTPAVTCGAEDQITSEWVGLDGATSTTVEQDGTISWCFEGTPTYYTWYEMYPAGTTTVGATLKPGDKIAAKVTRVGTAYTLSVTDSTNTANSFSVKKTCATTTCLDTSAEWISERSSFSIGIAPLADYKTWSLSSGAETASGKVGTISSFTPNDEITMIDGTGSYNLSTPSALTGGKAFTTTWLNSY